MTSGVSPGPARTLLPILLLPGTVLVLVPTLLLARSGGPRPGWGLGSPAPALALALGCLFVALGLALLGRTIAHFARAGRGTLAPWDPTQRLVVEGVYRRVRNPMISGVLSVLLGESLASGSLAVGAWFLAFATLNAVYIPLVEERGLARRFGADYGEYRRNVPRWIPRGKPWTPPWSGT